MDYDLDKLEYDFISSIKDGAERDILLKKVELSIEDSCTKICNYATEISNIAIATEVNSMALMYVLTFLEDAERVLKNACIGIQDINKKFPPNKAASINKIDIKF